MNFSARELELLISIEFLSFFSSFLFSLNICDSVSEIPRRQLNWLILYLYLYFSMQWFQSDATYGWWLMKLLQYHLDLLVWWEILARLSTAYYEK